MNNSERKMLIMETRSLLERRHAGVAEEMSVSVLDFQDDAGEYGGKLLYESENYYIVCTGSIILSETRALVCWEKVKEELQVQWILPIPPEEQNRKKQLILRGGSGEQYLLQTREITCVEASNMDCIVHCVDGSAIKARETFGSLCTRLPADFCRIHRSFAVNREAVRSVQPYMVRLRDGLRLPIPEKRYQQVRSELFR